MIRARHIRHRTLASFALIALAAACARNPATGERELALIGEQQEVEMGREADQQIVASLGVYEEEGVQDYVADIGQRLAAESERPDLPWTFRVLDDPTVNAFALPGGFVYITRGIMTHLTSEAQLAGILGHEIGHITARHSVNQISRAQVTQLGVGLGMVLVPELQQFAGLANVGMQLLFLKYGRDDENEADELGVRYMTREDYAPGELADVMAMLDRTSELQQGSGRVPQWLSTHPDPANRVEHIQEVIAELDAPVPEKVQEEQYLRTIDGVVFGSDPREGYFEGGVFYHPELQFRMRFPEGWQSMNTKQAVQSVAPEQDAVLLLTLAEGSPGDALDQFAAQQGVQVARASRESINGRDAVVAQFQASTEQGTLRGLVAFLSHEGSTFRLLGYAPEGAWPGHADAVSGSIGSFAPENDPRRIEVEPARVEVVEIGSAMSVQAFMQRYPSTVRPEIVALINQASVDGHLEAGSLVKRVVGGVETAPEGAPRR